MVAVNSSDHDTSIEENASAASPSMLPPTAFL